MACPTCGHTMQSVDYHVFWCPRCGTLKCRAGNDDADESPKLVHYVRAFLASKSDDATLDSVEMKALREAALTPEEREKTL